MTKRKKEYVEAREIRRSDKTCQKNLSHMNKDEAALEKGDKEVYE